MQDPDERRQRARDPRRLRPQQLGRVGVLLLRHDARAGGEVVGGLAEAELLARPEHDLAAEPREVGRADGGRVEVVEREVAVGDRVDRVRRRRLEAELGGRRLAVEVPVEPGQRAGAERHRRRGRGGVGEPLRVARAASRSRRAGDGRGRPAGRAAGGCSRASASRRGASASVSSRSISAAISSLARARALAHVERQVGGHLVVAGAAGVELAAQRADELGQPALDRHVDVLVAGSERELVALELGRDQVEAAAQLGELLGGEHPGALERRAWAREPACRRGHSRRSKPIEALMRANRGSGASSKRGIARPLSQSVLKIRGRLSGRWRSACASSPATPE